MKSVLVFLVDNGEDTDILDEMIAAADSPAVIDWTVRIDVPSNVDVSFWVREDMVIGLPSRDHQHTTEPGE